MYKQDYQEAEKKARQAVKIADAVSYLAEMFGLAFAGGLLGLLVFDGERLEYAGGYFCGIVCGLAVCVIVRFFAESIASHEERQAEFMRKLSYTTPQRPSGRLGRRA